MDVTTMTDQELEDAFEQITSERARRAQVVSIPDRIDQLVVDFLDATGRSDGSEWVQPGGAYDAYPEGWTVTHNDKTWISNVAANVWEPGVSSWTLVTPPEVVPEWIQPTGATDAYAAEAKVVHNGHTWQSDVDANVWEPGVYGWTDLGAVQTEG